ncbi:MAG: polyamine aminopropyltransferase [Myxococcota bacterium]
MSEAKPEGGQARQLVLLTSVFLVAVAGLVYELIAGTLTTYLLGSSVLAFSVVIGLFLSAMGLGAFLAQYIKRDLIGAFINAEIALAAVGGSSALVLFWSFAILTDGYQLMLGLVCLACGALVGVEIPLLLRILEERVDLRVAASHVLALDYAGALLGSLAFPLLLLPQLGLVRAAALLGLMNLGVAAVTQYILNVRRRGAQLAMVVIAIALSAIFIGGGQATSWLEDRLYSDPVLLSKTTAYQRVVVTRWRDDLRMYVEGHLQFSSQDEYRYHEALVHPAMASASERKAILILGGGDGLAAREVLKHPGVAEIDLVDLDPAVTDLFSSHPLLTAINEDALNDDRVTIHNQDAIKFLEQATRRWDVIIMDLPDPNDAALSRLYTVASFRLASRRLRSGGALVSQATSPFYAPEAFWCIVETAREGMASHEIHPYHAQVPSFGEWGFILAANQGPSPLVGLESRRFLTDAVYRSMFDFPVDLAPRRVQANHLADAVLARYYRDGWMRVQDP